jgi:hypothetical protein
MIVRLVTHQCPKVASTKQASALNWRNQCDPARLALRSGGLQHGPAVSDPAQAVCPVGVGSSGRTKNPVREASADGGLVWVLGSGKMTLRKRHVTTFNHPASGNNPGFGDLRG